MENSAEPSQNIYFISKYDPPHTPLASIKVNYVKKSGIFVFILYSHVFDQLYLKCTI